MIVLEHQTLEMKNVLSFRGKMTQLELQAKTIEIEKILKDSDVQKTAPIVTTTFSVENGPGGLLMDVEILTPLNHEINLPDGFVWKPHFLLTNAAMIHYVGNPASLQNCAKEFDAYVADHHLVPITTGYNVTTPQGLGQIEVYIYVGISPNIL